jgi:hypothetical protein
MSRTLVTIGIIIVILGLVWPWIQKSGIGRLPGDIFIERDNFRFYLPVTTSIIVSLIVTLLFWLFRK